MPAQLMMASPPMRKKQLAALPTKSTKSKKSKKSKKKKTNKTNKDGKASYLRGKDVREMARKDVGPSAGPRQRTKVVPENKFGKKRRGKQRRYNYVPRTLQEYRVMLEEAKKELGGLGPDLLCEEHLRQKSIYVRRCDYGQWAFGLNLEHKQVATTWLPNLPGPQPTGQLVKIVLLPEVVKDKRKDKGKPRRARSASPKRRQAKLEPAIKSPGGKNIEARAVKRKVKRTGWNSDPKAAPTAPKRAESPYVAPMFEHFEFDTFDEPIKEESEQRDEEAEPTPRPPASAKGIVA